MEPVSVIPFDDPVEGVLGRETVRLADVRESPGKIPLQFSMRIAEERRGHGVHGQVVEIVEVGEDGDLRELGNARDEREAQPPLLGLHDGVERLERIAERGHVRARQVPEERLVVFVDQEDRPAVGRPRGEIVDQEAEAGGRVRTAQRDAQTPGLRFQHDVQRSPEIRHRLGLAAAHVETEDGPGPRPIPLGLDLQPAEQVAPALEEALERGDGERLAKPARARDEELRAARTVHQRKQPPRLVDVDVAVLPQTFKGIGVCRNPLHAV